MSIATIEIQPSVKAVTFIDDQISVEIADGRTVFAPLTWYPRLQYATKAEREDWVVFEDSESRDIIFWGSTALIRGVVADRPKNRNRFLVYIPNACI